MADSKTDELKKILDIVNREDKFVKYEDAATFFKSLTDFVKTIRPALEEHFNERILPGMEHDLVRAHSETRTEVIRRFEAFEDRIESSARDHKLGNRNEIDSFRSEVRVLCDHLAEVVENLPRIDEIQELIEAVRSDIKESENAEQIRDRLESLEGDERLDKSAIRGLEELEEEFRSGGNRTPEIQAAGYGLDVFIDGDDKGFTKYLNLIPGAGVSISYNRVGERVDVTISADSSGGGLSILTATGAVDDSNTVFTFPSEPQIVVVNGASYREGHGVSITGTTATLNYPVGTGGDLYGLG